MANLPHQETVIVETREVSCDGGGGALGHPMIYIPIGETGQSECPYCSKRFVLKEGAGHTSAH
ncbi:MAG TPA: zinc-finger domain-containing protein [Alphaproteobacteria bacterium]|nr:zinc-finger domain-containing protein [Alphaproteobacteria bacterium]